jgi:glutathione S-transferase
LIAAEYNGVKVDVLTDLAAAGTVSPVGKLPVLVTPKGDAIFSSHAAARFVAGLRRDSGLTGDTLVEAAAIDSWMDWAAADLELPACVWFYPVAGYMPFNAVRYYIRVACCEDDDDDDDDGVVEDKVECCVVVEKEWNSILSLLLSIAV